MVVVSVCVCGVCMSVVCNVCGMVFNVYVCGICTGVPCLQKAEDGSRSSELGLQGIVSCLRWMLGTELMFSLRAVPSS